MSAATNISTFKLAPNLVAWGLATTASILAIVAWGSDYGWTLLPFNSYRWFPLFGLMAFSLMWTHYAVGALMTLFGWQRAELAQFYSLTGWKVLILLLLHPGLLIYQLFRDGLGLPPGSYWSYVGPGLGWVALLGTVSLLVFLAYELRRLYGQRAWWTYVARAGDVAMLAIFYHGLRLGGQIHGWFRFVWWFYGLTLVLILAHGWWRRRRLAQAL